MRISATAARMCALIPISVLSCATANASEVIIRAGAVWSDPSGNGFELPSDIVVPTPLGTNPKVDIGSGGTQFAGDITWLFAKNFGIEFWMNSSFDSDLKLKTSTGSQMLGTIKYESPMLDLQWHIIPDGAFRPYIGVGYHETSFNDAPYGKLDDTGGWAGVLGADFGPADGHWFFNASVRYLDLSPTYKLQAWNRPATPEVPSQPIFPPPPEVWPPVAGESYTTFSRSADVNPWIYGISVGWRFGHESPKTAEAPMAAAPVAAAPPPPAKCADSDNDGVCDSADRCPNTSAGDRVGPNGCSCDVTIQTHFAFDSADLSAEDKATLDKVAARLQELQFVEGVANGHTDNVGDEAYNQKLSERRAQAVADYLGIKGVAPGRIKAVGYGASRPIADNGTEEGRAQNRRVTIHRTDCGPAN